MKHLTGRSHHLAARRAAVRGRGAAARAVSDPAFDPALTVRAPSPAPALAPPSARREGAHGGGRVHRPRDVGRGAGPPARGALPGPSRPGPRGS